MARTHVKRRHSDVLEFESVARISSLPIVESGIHIAGNVYYKIKVNKYNELLSLPLNYFQKLILIAK